MLEKNSVKYERMKIGKQCFYNKTHIGSKKCLSCEYNANKLQSNSVVLCSFKFEEMYDMFKQRMIKEFNLEYDNCFIKEGF